MDRRLVTPLCALWVLWGSAAPAEVLVYPNGNRAPGDLAGIMGGNWGALAKGTDALFYNPAGLAAERGGAVSAGGEALRLQDVAAGDARSERLDASPGHLAWASGPARRGAAAPLGWGWYAHWPQDQDSSLSGRGSSTSAAASLPEAIDTGGLDAFTDGVTRQERRSGDAAYSVLATGVALGAELASGLSAGVGAVLERVRFRASASRLATYAAGTEDGASYRASIQESSRIEGVADRWAPLLGVQARPLAGLALGLALRLPSRALGGEGSVSYSRASQATLSAAEGSVTLDELVLGEATGRQFELRTPLEATLSAGLASGRFALVLEVIRSDGLPAYTVIDIPESEPPSTAAFRPPAYRTGLRPRTRWGLGMSYAATDSAALGIGFRDDTSAVSGEDRVFRQVDLYSISTGVILHRSNVAAALGLVYLVAPRQSVSFPSPLGDEREARSLDAQTLTLRVGASWVL